MDEKTIIVNKKERIAKMPVRVLADVLRGAGVERCVVSPGSRNAPVILELSRMEFDMYTVIDERTAAFVALGMAKAGRKPVAVVCTSGTAVLNLAPALAEAYYSHVPLVAITADRPESDIDQYMGQTIRQNEALGAVVRCSVAIGEKMDVGQVNRLVNKAVWAAKGPIPGPVQINVHLSLPLTAVCVAPAREGHYMEPFRPGISLTGLTLPFAPESKVLTLIGSQLDKTTDLNMAVSRLVQKPNAVVLAEIQANIPAALRLARFTGRRSLLSPPDVAVIAGGSFVDPTILKKLAEWNTPIVTVGIETEPVTRGLNVIAHFDMKPAVFFNFLADNLVSGNNYMRECAADNSGSDRIISLILNALPTRASTFITNGMCIRHAQHSPRTDLKVMTNRGVSGIDGCTSTAVGAAMALEKPLFLISGDMGAFYDIGALAVDAIPSGFHMFVIDNGGGDIFRHVATTASLPSDELQRFFVAPPKPVLADFARNCGIRFFSVSSADLTEEIVRDFTTVSGPAILNIKQTR